MRGKGRYTPYFFFAFVTSVPRLPCPLILVQDLFLGVVVSNTLRGQGGMADKAGTKAAFHGKV